jgi:6-phosphogluconolactonase
MPSRNFLAFIFVALLTFAGCGSGTTGHGCPLSAGGCCGPAIACQGPQYLYAAGLNSQVAVFPVDNSTGGLGSPTTIPGPALSFGMAALDSQFVYVASPTFTVGGASSIDGWSIGTAGDLTPVPSSPFSLGPFTFSGGLAADDAAQVLYVADAGKIDALKADATGALSSVLGSPFPAGSNLYLTVDPQHRFLFASDDTPPGNVLAFTIDPSTGALTAVQGSPFATIPNNVGDTQPAEIAVDQSSSFVFTALQTTNQIAAFAIMAPSGALTPVPGSPFNSGIHPLSLATVSNFLYVSNAGDGTISGYSINTTSGILTPLANSPFPIPVGPLTSGGRFLYADGPGGVVAFSVDVTTGALTQVGSPVTYPGASVLTLVQAE